MILVEDYYVYVPRLDKYGRVVEMFEREDIFYKVTFPWDFVNDREFLASDLVKLESTFFQIGEKVTGLKRAKRYNYTTEKAIMEVIDRDNNGKILVKILQHKDKPHIVGAEHWVDSIWFKLVRHRTNFCRGEKEN